MVSLHNKSIPSGVHAECFFVFHCGGQKKCFRFFLEREGVNQVMRRQVEDCRHGDALVCFGEECARAEGGVFGEDDFEVISEVVRLDEGEDLGES